MVSDHTAAPPSAPPTGPSALVTAAADTERHVGRSGWDQPPRMFALVRTAQLVLREPSMRTQLRDADPHGFTAVEQEGLLRTTDLEALLARVAWPDEVDGVALSVERLVVPPEAERDLPPDPAKATEQLAAHPARQDVRLLVAVTREGDSVCLLRQRAHDQDDAVAVGKDISPGLVHALRLTLEDPEAEGDSRVEADPVV